MLDGKKTLDFMNNTAEGRLEIACCAAAAKKALYMDDSLWDNVGRYFLAVAIDNGLVDIDNYDLNGDNFIIGPHLFSTEEEPADEETRNLLCKFCQRFFKVRSKIKPKEAAGEEPKC